MTKEDLIRKKISAINLGCDKNRVDLEHILFSLQDYGFDIVSDNTKCDILIVNTCAFIVPAVEEAIENINYAISLKQEKKVEKIIVSGCFPQREYKLLKENYPEIDYLLKLKENDKIVQIIENLYGVKNTKYDNDTTGRIITNEGKYAYLKIADGCSNGCAYCTIPRIRGRFKSVPYKNLIKEAKKLANLGYKELIIVAQDTARYGVDLYGEPKLIDLLEDICKIKEIQWVRLQYIYPEWVNDKLLDFIVKEEKMCKYLDMPLQHIDNDILIAMNRKTNEERTRQIVENIRTNYPAITLRSTFIIGFPGETKKQFNKLCNFISKGNIDYATFFTYYREEKTKAYFMKKQIFEFIKKLRYKKIVQLQNIVLNKANKQKIGNTEQVLIDNYDENTNNFIGHSKNNSPKIDFCVIINKSTTDKVIEIGKIYNVRLIEITENGFKGEVL